MLLEWAEWVDEWVWFDRYLLICSLDSHLNCSTISRSQDVINSVRAAVCCYVWSSIYEITDIVSWDCGYDGSSDTAVLLV